MDINEATRISDFIRDTLVRAVEAGKEVDIYLDRGVKNVTEKTETVTRMAPSGELNFRLHIPADQ